VTRLPCPKLMVSVMDFEQEDANLSGELVGGLGATG
jgi:hypothetical protein